MKRARLKDPAKLIELGARLAEAKRTLSAVDYLSFKRRESELRHEVKPGQLTRDKDPKLECHELRRYGPDGKVSASPAPGVWLCPEHAPAKQPTARAVRGTPLEAVDEFERLLADEGARLMESLSDKDGNNDDNEAAFGAFRREIERGLGQLREVIAKREKPPASNMPKPRRSSRKQITTRERNQPGQTSLIEEEPIRETS